MLRSCEKSISREKETVLPLRNFRLLHYPGILQRLQHHFIQFPLYYLLVVAYGRLKTQENFKLLALKVVAVAYERRSLTRGSQYSDLAKKLLVFWKTGRWGEEVAYKRWDTTRGSTVPHVSSLNYLILFSPVSVGSRQFACISLSWQIDTGYTIQDL